MKNRPEWGGELEGGLERGVVGVVLGVAADFLEVWLSETCEVFAPVGFGAEVNFFGVEDGVGFVEDGIEYIVGAGEVFETNVAHLAVEILNADIDHLKSGSNLFEEPNFVVVEAVWLGAVAENLVVGLLADDFGAISGEFDVVVVAKGLVGSVEKADEVVRKTYVGADAFEVKVNLINIGVTFDLGQRPKNGREDGVGIAEVGKKNFAVIGDEVVDFDTDVGSGEKVVEFDGVFDVLRGNLGPILRISEICHGYPSFEDRNEMYKTIFIIA